MRLYHWRATHPEAYRSRNHLTFWLYACLVVALLASCATPAAQPGPIVVRLTADGETRPVDAQAGSSVQQVLESAGITLTPLDRSEPPVTTILLQDSDVRVVRVSEEFEVQEEIIPFERQTLRNESLATDQEVLLQKGQNGRREVTFRRVFEDGVEVTDQPIPIQVTVLEEPVPEILMVGIQTPFYPVAVPGQLIYLRDGNAWRIEGNTGNRQAVVTTGDLDGRVLSLSADGNWLLFTRSSPNEGEINRLAVAFIGDEAEASAANLNVEGGEPIDLEVPNVVHFADWMPGSDQRIIFSTVEPRSTPPGWQANNDLHLLTFSTSGWTTRWTTLLEPNTGGVYGWWGTSFQWSPDGARLAFTRPDSMGLVNLDEGILENRLNITPLQTRGDWAWSPALTWGPDGKALYTVEHVAAAGASSPEESPDFDLSVVSLEGAPTVRLAPMTGMFAYPLASPLHTLPTGESGYLIAYLQAIFPSQSETSRYRLMVMDRDGSDRLALFPPEGSAGIDPQAGWAAWSPEPLPDSEHLSLAVIYQGNLWLVDTVSGEAQQVTGDGLTTRVLWK